MVSKILCAIGAISGLLAHLVSSAAVPPIPGYAVVDVEWALPIDPKVSTGPREVVTGTIQEAIAKMAATHPGWDLPLTSHLNFTNHLNTAPARHNMLTNLDDNKPLSQECKFNSGKGKADCSAIRDGAGYLARIPDNSAPPRNSPKSCGRVSCSWDSAIWWCNDNHFEKEVTWDAIAKIAWDLQAQCASEPFYTHVSARQFMEGNWNVYVTGDFC
ncbi:hypothetical protein QBC41DRAFT_304977 [Cercophora samala]|uniref:Uncharacterized protein n=1 Tax=Cercophora samala TaxID=330535 RepID=A0AA40DAT5_9PEZI|nr:hypothetical protein QBC41DRAFT_304977 [Cercophora samala]